MKNNPLAPRKHKPNSKYDIRVLKEFTELYDWLKELSLYRKIEDSIYIHDYKKGEIRLRIFTKDHYYTIVAKIPTEERPSGYLGTYGQVRKARAGEDWTRGSDLPDGSYSRETWDNFKNALISYELVKVVRHSPDTQDK